jgi:hypothetical protein
MAYCAKLQEFHPGDKRAVLQTDNNILMYVSGVKP